MSKSIAYKHYIRALARWPKDNLRPECQFQDAMRRRVERRFLPASSTDKSNATQPIAPNSPLDEKFELEQVNAIYSLLENRYSRKYPITGSLMKPKSNPTHFTDLIKELEAAPERGFFARAINKWKGFLRFQ